MCCLSFYSIHSWFIFFDAVWCPKGNERSKCIHIYHLFLPSFRPNWGLSHATYTQECNCLVIFIHVFLIICNQQKSSKSLIRRGHKYSLYKLLFISKNVGEMYFKPKRSHAQMSSSLFLSPSRIGLHSWWLEAYIFRNQLLVVCTQ